MWVLGVLHRVLGVLHRGLGRLTPRGKRVPTQLLDRFPQPTTPPPLLLQDWPLGWCGSRTARTAVLAAPNRHLGPLGPLPLPRLCPTWRQKHPPGVHSETGLSSGGQRSGAAYQWPLSVGEPKRVPVGIPAPPPFMSGAARNPCSLPTDFRTGSWGWRLNRR